MKKIALVGFGNMGAMHLQAFEHIAGAQVAGLVSRRPRVTREKLRKLGLRVPVYPDLKSLLDQEDIDAVDICLPTDEHEASACEAFRAGKHVFCEKPIALTGESAERMLRAANKAGVVFMVGQCLRFWPEYQAFASLVKSGQAGRLLSLSMQRRSAAPRAGSWFLDEKRSGGCLFDLHIHDTDFVHHLLGPPRKVISHGTRDAAGWSHVFTTYCFEDLVVTAEGGWNYPPKWGFQMAFQAVFEKGAVEYDSGATPTLTATLGATARKKLPFQRLAPGSSRIQAGNISSLSAYYAELDYFIRCVERGVSPEIATGEQALATLKTLLAERRSLQSGGKPAEVSPTVQAKSTSAGDLLCPGPR